MFITLRVRSLAMSESEWKNERFDVNRIVKIWEADTNGVAAFTFAAGNYIESFDTEGLTADDLVEAVILARMNPSMCLPSPNVGKDEDDVGSTNSLGWSRNAKQPRKKFKLDT